MNRACSLILTFALLTACSATRPQPPRTTVDPVITAEIARFERLLASDPSKLHYAYVLAEYYDVAHDTANTLRLLRRLDASGWKLGVDPASFTNSSTLPDFRELASKLDARAAEVSKARPAFTLPAAVRSEGSAYDPVDDVLYFSGGATRLIRVTRSGTASELAIDSPGDGFGRLGLEVDPQRRQLWAISAVYRRDAPPEQKGRSAISVYDLASGHLLRRVFVGSAAEPAFLNDLEVLADGTAFVTDTTRNQVLRLSPGAEAFEVFASGFHAPNGIAAAADERTIYVADFRGIDAVAIDGKSRELLETSELLNGIDGLVEYHDTLVGIQNVLGRPRVLQIDLRSGKVELLESRDPRLHGPTTGVVARDEYFFIGNLSEKDADRVVLRIAMDPSRQVRDLVDEALRALGASADARADFPVVEFTAAGTYFAREQAATPEEDVARAARRYRYVIDGKNRRMRREADLLYPGGIRFSTLTVVEPDGGFQVDLLKWRQGTDLGAVDAREATESWITFSRFLPHLVLLQARESALTEPQPTDAAPRRLQFHDATGTAITVDLSNEALPLRLTAQPPSGPVTVLTYSRYERARSLLVPREISVDVGGRRLEEITLHDVEVKKEAAQCEFVVPPGYSLPPPASPPAARALAKDIYYLDNMPGGYHSIFVDGPDGVTVLEAPLSPQHAEKALELIRSVVPAKPIRRVLITHHHGDHIGGLAPFITAGAVVAAHPAAEVAIRRQLADRFPEVAAQVRFELHDRRRTIGGGSSRIDVIPIESSHASPALLFYLPAARILFQGDLFYAPERGPIPPPFPVTEDLTRALAVHHLPARLIAGVHGRIATAAELQSIPKAEPRAIQERPLCLDALPPVAIENVGIVDVAAGRVLPGRTVVVGGDGRIQQITKGPGSARETIDGTGKFLIPGLWDMHVHFPGSPAEFLPLFVGHGVTSVRDMGSSLETLKWRAAVENHRVVGPTIVTCGLILDDAPGDWPFRLRVRTADEARAAVDRRANEGVDCIKVHNLLPRVAYFAAVEEATRRRLPVVGHVPLTVQLSEAIAAGQHTIEHLSEFRMAQECASGCEPLLHSMRDAHVFNTPTLVSLRKIAGVSGGQATDEVTDGVPQSLRAMWRDLDERFFSSRDSAQTEQLQRLYATALRTVGAMKGAGVPILAGTDIGIPGLVPGASLHEELVVLVESGLSPAEALAAATINPAASMGLGRTVGVIERGSVADLVLLDADPLVDIRNTRRIAAVVSHGRLFRGAELEELRRVKGVRPSDGKD